jgi:hypothetical protein
MNEAEFAAGMVVGAIAAALAACIIVLCVHATSPTDHKAQDQNRCKIADGVLLKDVSGHYACVDTDVLKFYHEPHFYGDDNE